MRATPGRYRRLNAHGMSMARDVPARADESRTRIVARLRPTGETS